MIRRSRLLLLPALAGAAAAAVAASGHPRPAPDRAEQSARIDQSVVLAQSEVVLRIPIRARPAPVDWEERKGPRCVSVEDISGAALSGPDGVDFILDDRRRVRAEFADDCPALDFYSGFYISPEDRRICARRDSVRSRMGGSCPIARFRELVRKP